MNKNTHLKFTVICSYAIVWRNVMITLFKSILKIAFIYFAFKVVKGKDLPGAINVLPAGLGEVLKKRESREFKMEVNIFLYIL